MEYSLNHRNRSQADLYVENIPEGDDFLVEVKRAEELENGEEVKRPLQKYFRDIDNRRDLALDKAFLCIIGETTPEYSPEETESMDLSEFVNIPSTLDNLETEIDRLEVVLNKQELWDAVQSITHGTCIVLMI